MAENGKVIALSLVETSASADGAAQSQVEPGRTTERRTGAVPKTIGPYTVRGTLGSGGMGIVYDAVHRESGRPVAIKTMQNKADRAMFAALRGEVTVLQRLKHPYVVSIVDEGMSEAWPWYAMERIEGRTFADYNARLWSTFDSASTTQTLGASHESGEPTEYPSSPTSGRRPRARIAAGKLPEVADSYAKLCEALMHLHAQGIVHRDVKPSNIMMRPDRTPVLMDFGISSRWTTDRDEMHESVKHNNPFVGSASYLSPEQSRREFVDSRADLYSLGCAIYETLSGRPPFVAATPRELLEKHRLEVPPRVSELLDDVPDEIDELLARLLAKRPRDRIGHADDVARVLVRFAPRRGTTRGSAAPPPPQPHLYRPTLVGRDDVLEKIRARLQAANRGQGAALLIGGESGIGKTFLAAEAARQADLCGVHVVTCSSRAVAGGAEGKAPHAEVLSSFRGLLAAFADRFRDCSLPAQVGVPADAAAVLAPYEPALRAFASNGVRNSSPIPPEAARLRIFEAITHVLSACAPLLLVLDDMQRADELSLAFLEWLPSRLIANEPILILGLFRPEEATLSIQSLLNRRDFEQLTLDRLPESALIAMTGDMLAMERPPAAFMRFVIRRSEGNPFFASEYLRLFTAERLLQRRSGEWVLEKELAANEDAYERLHLPSSVKAVVARRLRHLEGGEQTVVEAAAILGREFDDEVLAAVVGGDPVVIENSLRALTAKTVFDEVGKGRHRFAHDHVRAVAYDQIPAATRQELHLATGRCLVNQDPSGVAGNGYAELAHHFQQGRDPVLTRHYTEKAADHALSTFANRDAARFFGDLLGHEKAKDEPPRRLARWERGLGDALHGMGLLDESRTHLENALGLLGQPTPSSSASRAAKAAGQVFLQTAYRASPRRMIARNAEQRLLAQEASQAYDRLLQIFYYRGQQLEMFYATLKTLNLAEEVGPSSELARAYAIAHAVAGVMPVRWLAEAYLENANDILNEIPDASVESYLLLLTGVYRSGVAEWARASDAFERGLLAAKSLGFHRRCDEIALGLANWNYLQGRFAEATAQVSGPSLLSRGDPQACAWRLLVRAQVALARGANDDAIEPATEAKALTGKLQRSELMWMFAILALVALRRREVIEARGWADRAAEQIASGPPVTFYCIEAYSIVCDVYLQLWEEADRQKRQSRELRSCAMGASRALSAFAHIFPAAAPRSTLHEGTVLYLNGHSKRARTSWNRSAEKSVTLGMPHDEMLAETQLARTLPHGSRERVARLNAVIDRAEKLDAGALRMQGAAYLRED